MNSGNLRRPNAGRSTTTAAGLAALAALVALVVLPPLGLVFGVGNPVPDRITVDGKLTDAAVVGALAGIVWVAWAQLMFVVTIEAVAAIRGRGLPRLLPGCGFQQHLARKLVVAASLLLTGLSTAPISAGAAVAAPGASASPYEEVTGTAAASLASSRVDPEHSALADPVIGPALLPVLADPKSRHEAATGTELWYVVKPPRGHHHDSLWDIAERHLGDGMRWREIYELNRHRPQPDGRRLELARLIQPGWRLLMPIDATGIAPKTSQSRRGSGGEEQRPEPAKVDTAPADEAAPSIPHARPGEDVPRPSTTADSRWLPLVPAIGSQVPSSALANGRTTPAEVDQAGPDDVAVPFGQLTLGLGAVACAGLVAELARRRRRAQRFRLPGERLPRPSEPAAAAERQLRTANAELTVIDLRDALRLLAAECRAQGRALPDVHAISLNATAATLHLGIAAEPVAPFVADSETTWGLDSDLLELADRADLAENGIDPYPALVSLGVTDEAVLLVNLEAAGTLTIAGSPTETTPILHALIAELGTSLLSSTAHLVITDCSPDLAAMLDHGRVTVLGPGQATRWAETRGRDVTAILQSAGVPDVAAARVAGVADDVWAPAVLLIGASTGDATDPAAGVSLVRVAEGPGTGWTLCRADGDWRLDPLGSAFTPQRLDLDTVAPLAEALTTAELPAALPETLDTTTPAPALKESAAEEVSAEGPDSGPAPGPAVVRARVVPRPAVPTDVVPTPSAPRVLVLGPVEIVGVADDGAPGRKRRATELVAYLALHPGATHYQLDEALWPGYRVSRNTRNPVISRARQWLGTNSAGEPYLGLAAEGGHYTLSPEVSCDWREFSALAERGLAAGADGSTDLVAALELVRGRPFLGVNPAAYGWAESVTQDMISAVVDIAHALADLALDQGDYRCARWAAARGISVEPVAEELYRDAIRAAEGAGDPDDVARLLVAARRQVADLDPDDDFAGLTADNNALDRLAHRAGTR